MEPFFAVFLCLSPLATSLWSVFNSLSQVPARPFLRASDSAQPVGEGSWDFPSSLPSNPTVQEFRPFGGIPLQLSSSRVPCSVLLLDLVFFPLEVLCFLSQCGRVWRSEVLLLLSHHLPRILPIHLSHNSFIILCLYNYNVFVPTPAS